MGYQHENLVVCGVDGSELSLRALAWAAEDARPRGARLEVLTVYTPGDHDDAAHQGALSIARDAARTVSGLEVTVSAEPGDAAGVLLERSKVARRIVVGTRGAGSGATNGVGRVARTVASRAYCTVVVIPPLDRSVLPIRHIIAGVDGSQASTYAYSVAVKEAASMGARLSAVDVVRIQATGPLTGENVARDILEDTRNELALKLSSYADAEGVEQEYHAIEGVPSKVLAKFSGAVDLIVVGTSGWGGIRGMILGSTASNLLDQARGPIMIVPRRADSNHYAGEEGAA